MKFPSGSRYSASMGLGLGTHMYIYTSWDGFWGLIPCWRSNWTLWVFYSPPKPGSQSAGGRARERMMPSSGLRVGQLPRSRGGVRWLLVGIRQKPRTSVYVSVYVSVDVCLCVYLCHEFCSRMPTCKPPSGHSLKSNPITFSVHDLHVASMHASCTCAFRIPYPCTYVQCFQNGDGPLLMVAR